MSAAAAACVSSLRKEASKEIFADRHKDTGKLLLSRSATSKKLQKKEEEAFAQRPNSRTLKVFFAVLRNSHSNDSVNKLRANNFLCLGHFWTLQSVTMAQCIP